MLIRRAALLLALATTLPAASPLKVDDLAASSAPAFALLGLSPAAIDRPHSTRKLAVALASSALSVNRDYAMEFSPAWVFSPRNVKLGDLSSTPGVWQGLAESFAISFATKDNGAALGSTLGTGFRARLVEARPNSQVAAALDGLREAYLEAYFPKDEDPTQLANGPGPSAAQEGRVRSKALALQPLLNRREGFSLDLAGGVTTELPSNDLDQAYSHKDGLWLTPAYAFANKVDSLAILRYLRDETDAKKDSLDWGFRLGLSFDDFSLSSEYVRRHRFVPDTLTAEYRLAGLVEYRVASDITLTASFGRDFSSPTKPGENLLSQIGLKFGLRPEVEDPKHAFAGGS